MTKIVTEIEMLCRSNRYCIKYQLTYGMSKKEVLAKMGNKGYEGRYVSIDQPVKIETFRRDGSNYEVYYYLIDTDPSPYSLTSCPRELGKVIFMNDKYVGDHRRMMRKCVKPLLGAQLLLMFDDR